MEALSEKELTRLGREWQKRLRLQDWRLRFELGDSSSANGFAHTRFGCGKSAVVELEKLSNVDKRYVSCRDMEVSLVHELLHLHALDFDHLIHLTKEDGTKTRLQKEYDALETMIELTAQALVSAKRGRMVKIA